MSYMFGFEAATARAQRDVAAANSTIVFDDDYRNPITHKDDKQALGLIESLPNDCQFGSKADYQNEFNHNFKVHFQGDTQHDFHGEFESDFENDYQSSSTLEMTDLTHIRNKSAAVEEIYPSHELWSTSTVDDHSPMVLGLRRKGCSDITEIYDPTNGMPIYSICDKDRNVITRHHRLEICRVVSGDCPLATVNYGTRTTVSSASTGTSHHNINKLQPSYLRECKPSGALTWSVKRAKKKPRWYRTEDTYDPEAFELRIKEPLLTLGLVDKVRPSDQPLCVVTMWAVRPTGMIEIWAKSARIDQAGGDWAALDELIVSAYANMEQARRKVLHGNDDILVTIVFIIIFLAVMLSLNLLKWEQKPPEHQ